MKTKYQQNFLALALVGALAFVSGCETEHKGKCCKAARSSGEIEGHVLIAGQPIAGATVTLYAAGEGAPTQVAQTKTAADGAFELDAKSAPKDSVFYLVAKGPNEAVALMSLLGTSLPEEVTVNELTTVASAFTAARFINGEAISGKPLSLHIAAGNTPNLVDPATGGWGKVLLDPLNSSMTTTMANLDTLGSLISAYATVANDDWRARFLKAATPTGGVDAKEHARSDGRYRPRTVGRAQGALRLFDEAYPQPAGRFPAQRALRAVSRLRPGRLRPLAVLLGRRRLCQWPFHVRCGRQSLERQNWMPGSQSGVNKSIGGGVVKFAPNGTALSPPITGFTGMGIDGVGWGTAVTKDQVWISSFNGKILVMDFNGKPVASESDFPFKEKFLGLMGIGVAANGDVWIADGSDNQLLFFPGGRIKDGRIVKVAGLKSPFDIVIDAQNRVWVSNSQSDTVVRFPANDPSKAETFRAGIGVRALALDSKGNVWVASNMSLDFPMPKVPDGASIMEQFKIMDWAMLKYHPPKPTGVVNMIHPDGTQTAPMGYTGDGGQYSVGCEYRRQ